MIKYVNQCTMHICGMDFSSLASYWQIKALLMLEPSVVTPQNQYFPANSERMSVHCLESGCIGKYTHLGPRDFPRLRILHPSALEIALGLRPWAISRASGCEIPTRGKSLGPRGVTKWSPHIHQVVTMWSPTGHQMVIKWSTRGH